MTREIDTQLTVAHIGSEMEIFCHICPHDRGNQSWTNKRYSPLRVAGFKRFFPTCLNQGTSFGIVFSAVCSCRGI